MVQSSDAVLLRYWKVSTTSMGGIIITNNQKSKIVFVSCSTVSCYRNVGGCIVPVAKIACQLTHNLGFMACATKFRVKIAWMDDVCVCVRARVCVCSLGYLHVVANWVLADSHGDCCVPTWKLVTASIYRCSY